jgi:AraC family transcriptional regulator
MAPLRSSAASTDTLGCQTGSLHDDRELSGSGIRFYRKRGPGGAPHWVETPASDRGYLLGMSLSGGHTRRIQDGRQATRHQFEQDALYVRNFADPYRAELRGSFDFLLVELSRTALDQVTEDAGCGAIDGLNVATACRDELLSGLLRVLLPVLERPAEASTLLLDQITLAIGTRVAERYGERRLPVAARSRRLSRAQESLAKEMLRGRLDGELAIADVAQACGLSRSYFSTAFRETLGQTPHQWLTAQRIQRACELMAGSQTPLAEIAAACGFADQSHFTRVFARVTGQPPAQWRRER